MEKLEPCKPHAPGESKDISAAQFKLKISLLAFLPRSLARKAQSVTQKRVKILCRATCSTLPELMGAAADG